METSSATSGLYPIVHDLTDAEYGGCCCCDSQAIFGSFSLEELAVPIVTPRSVDELSLSPMATSSIVQPSSPTTTSSSTATTPMGSSSQRKNILLPPALQHRGKKKYKHHRRGYSMGIIGQGEDGTSCIGCNGAGADARGAFLHRRSHSSPCNASESDNSTTTDTPESEGPVSDASKFNDIFVLTRQILRCNLSTVWECVHRHSGVRYCVKVIDRRRFATLADEDAALREIAMLTSLANYNHPRIVELVQVMEDRRHFHIVTKLVKRGNLLTKLTQHLQQRHKHNRHNLGQPSRHSSDIPYQLLQTPGLNEQVVKQLARCLLQGVQFLHSLGICHHDLQPENLLLLDDYQVQICDFGCAVYLDGDYCCRGRYGNLHYAAPEVLLGRNHGTVSDMWSVGVILYYCLCGVLPFDDVSRYRLKEKIASGDYGFSGSNNGDNGTAISVDAIPGGRGHGVGNAWDTISRQAKQLISNLIHVNPQVRLTASEALEHPWLATAPSPPSSGESPQSGSTKRRRRGSLVHRLWTKIGFQSRRPSLEMDDLKTASTISSSHWSLGGIGDDSLVKK